MPTDLKWLKTFQKLVAARADLIVETLCGETGKEPMEAYSTEIIPTILTARYYRKRAPKLLKRKRVRPGLLFFNKRVSVERLPLGTVGIVGPSNLPFILTIGDAIPALAAGNRVILKPSEKTPLSAKLGVDLMLEAGLGKDCVDLRNGGPEIVDSLIRDSDFIFFTGSIPAGKEIAAKCGAQAKPCVLELGGKSAMIVLDDADIERAARACLWGKFSNQGRHCVAVERVYVDHKIFEAFCGALEAGLHEVATGKSRRDSDDEEVSLPMSPFLQELVQDALNKGARQAAPNHPILTACNHTMRVMKEEIFGPLLPVMAFSNFQNLISLVNDSPTGLSASIFTKNKKQGRILAQHLHVGNITINDVMANFSVMDAPFAGWKSSGAGLRHSPEGLLQFTKPKTILSHSFDLPGFKKREPWWYPYESKNLAFLKKIIARFF